MHMNYLPTISWPQAARTCLLFGFVLLVSIGLGTMLIQSGAIDAINNSGVLSEQSRKP